MDQLVVLINGPAGIGKSSLAPCVAARVANGACVAGDDLKAFIVTRAEPPTVAVGLAYVGAAALTDVYLAAGFERVVVDFVFEHPRHISRFTDALVSSARVMAITLWAPLDVVARRHGQRGRPGQSEDSAERSWRAIAEQLDHLGVVVDASGTVEETLALIDEQLDRATRP
jgi:ribose 1,5-bisphosphokinase PhnN